MSILESKNITDVLHYVDSDTLVIFDVDNTLIESATAVGGTAWFDYMLARLLQQGFSRDDAVKKLYRAFVTVQGFVNMKPVEENTVSVVQRLHGLGIKTLGLTARGFMVARETDRQLKAVGISLDKNTLYDEEIVFAEHDGFLKGVLFVKPFTDKGEKLFTFFERIKYQPKKVLFVDDMSHFLGEVSTVLAAKKIPFTGIRYGATDSRMVSFNGAKADEELRTLFHGTEYQALMDSFL